MKYIHKWQFPRLASAIVALFLWGVVSSFSLAATVTVTSPNGGESWLEWSVHNITWTTTGTIANVKIEYSTNSGSSYTTVAASWANSGHYGWTIPTTLSANCLVKISDAANASVFDVSDAVFSIDVCGFISGTVTDIWGTPIKDVEVDVYTQSYVFAAYVTTNAAGQYTIGSLGSGGYKVLFQPWYKNLNYQCQWYNDKNYFNPADTVNVVVGNTTGNINALLSEGGIISGRVTDEGGAGLSGIGIYAFAENSFLAYWTATSDTNGYYQINGLPTGNYGVWSELTGNGYPRKYYNNTYFSDASTPVSASAGAQTTGIDMVLEKGGYISGKVTDGAGNPISGIQVIAYDASSKSYIGAATLSTADGTYSLLVRAGQTKVYFDASSNPASGLHSQFYNLQNSLDNAGIVTVQKEQTTANVDAVLTTGGGKITVQVKNSQGLGVYAAIYLFDAQYHTRMKLAARTDANGFLEITGLYAGNYKLRCFDNYGELGRYDGQWYNGAKSYAAATAVSVAEGGNTPIVVIMTYQGASKKVDFNGDGQDDILWRYYGPGGYNAVWFLGSSQAAGSAPLPMLASPLEAGPRSLFSGSKLIYPDARDVSLGGKEGFSLKDPREFGGKIETNVPLLADPRDAPGVNSKKDILFLTPSFIDPRHIQYALPQTSSNNIGASGVSILGGASLPSVGDLNWQIVGTGDFNGDGQVDILWRYNGSGGANAFWYMNGTTLTGAANLPSVSDLNWQIVGTGDFNGDGQVDILWRNNGISGANAVWYMNGPTLTGAASLPSVSDVNWQIVGTGDFNGDGQVDILWRYNGPGGYNAVWYMNGAMLTGAASLPSVSDLSWQIVGTGDFNGDGQVDILWRYNGSGGANAVWYMTGATLTGGASLPSLADLLWKIVNR
jgi:hypothetical protein